MSVTGPQLDRITEAILAAYSRDELRRVLHMCMDIDFDAIAPDKGFAVQVYELAQWANRRDRALELLECVYEHNQGNAGLKALWAEAQGWGLADTPSSAAASTPQAQPPPSADAPPQLFLSYSRKDTAIMRRLHADLLAAGLTVWTDEGLEPGTPQWQDAIEAAIDNTRGMVVVLSPHAKSSEWVKIEVSFAQELGRRVFPVLVHGDKRTAVLLSLYNVQFVDARTEWDDIAARLIPALRKHLGVGAPPPTPAPPPVAPETRAPKPGEGAAASKLQPEAAPPPAAVSGAAPAVMHEPQAPPTTLPGAGPAETEKSPPKVAAPQPKVTKPTTALPLAIEWITIPAGEFLMGSDKKKDGRARDDETPQHKLYLPEYRIARVPVTVAQFAAFVQATGYRTTAEERGSAVVYTGSEWKDVKGANWSHPRGPQSDVRQKQDHPVTCVSWRDAQAFCQWAGVRLPTEAEWEKAARGTDGRIFPWGDDAPTKDHCNFAMNVKDTTPVGKYPRGASPYGVLDMAGNVWEWTSSLVKPYPYDAADGREDSEAGGSRTLRGGSWDNSEIYVRCANRYRDHPDYGYGYFGFRVLSPGFRS
jgi:formylglycine-generating enzyme required for sulfatase activity